KSPESVWPPTVILAPVPVSLKYGPAGRLVLEPFSSVVAGCAVVLSSSSKVPPRLTPGRDRATVPLSPPLTPELEMSSEPAPLVSCRNGGPRELTLPLPSDSDSCALLAVSDRPSADRASERSVVRV